jgi:hypothetical protein
MHHLLFVWHLVLTAATINGLLANKQDQMHDVCVVREVTLSGCYQGQCWLCPRRLHNVAAIP